MVIVGILRWCPVDAYSTVLSSRLLSAGALLSVESRNYKLSHPIALQATILIYEVSYIFSELGGANRSGWKLRKLFDIIENYIFIKLPLFSGNHEQKKVYFNCSSQLLNVLALVDSVFLNNFFFSNSDAWILSCVSSSGGGMHRQSRTANCSQH